MVKRLPIILWLLLASASYAQTRWCNTIKLLPEDKLIYPPIARAARVAGLVISRVTVTSTGSVGDIENIFGYPMLAETASRQIKEWKLISDVTSGSPCLGLVIVDFSFEEHPPEKSKAWSACTPNMVKIAVVTTTLALETTISDPAPINRHRWHW